MDGLSDTVACGTDSSGKVPGRRQLTPGSKTTEGVGWEVGGPEAGAHAGVQSRLIPVDA